MAASAPILIAGGGIGGLALALALARLGRPSVVLERQAEFAGIGAGIQIGPNGVRALQRLGVAEALERFTGKPDAVEIHGGASGRVLANLPLGDRIAARHGAPYWVAHRGDLHRVLLDAATADQRITLRAGFDVAAFAQTDAGVTATAPAGQTATGAALIGADGIWSSVRGALFPECRPEFAGATATRTVIAAAGAGPLAIPRVGLWLGPAAHVVHYPVRGGSEIAVVVIAREAWQGRDWNAQADTAVLRRHLAGFHASLTTTLGTVTSWRKWALYTLPELPAWGRGRVGLLGDAAHPMLPYLAQGGAFAMEDALVLADRLAASDDIAGAIGSYAARRRTRALRAQRASVRQGNIYRLAPPVSYARDMVLRLAPGALLMAGLDWLYGWRPGD